MSTEPAITAFGGLASTWESPTPRLGKDDAVLLKSLGQGAQQQACLVLQDELQDGPPDGPHGGARAGERIPLGTRRMLMGRSADCEICINHASISRCHAELSLEEGHYVLRDRGSANGTRVNNTVLQGPVRLADGDVLRLGNVALKFYAHQSLDALMHDRLYRLATIDADTEVFTKRYLMDALQREVRRARRTKQPLSVVALDLDHFKAVNDRFGTSAGDAVLRSTATLARALIRGSDLIGRTGGVSFAVVLPDTALAAAVDLAERMRAAMSHQMYPLDLVDHQGVRTVLHRQTASFGVAELLTEMPDARALLGAADRMLYAAKRGGRNCVSS